MARFTDVFSDETKRGYKIQSSEYLPSGKYPIIDQGQAQIVGYTNLENGLFTDVPAIIFGDHTRIVKYVDSPFFLGADGVKVLKSKVGDADYKYLFYCLQNAKIPNTGYNRHFKWLKEVDVPLPPLDEQRKIAAVLDKVRDLIAKRRQQLDKLDEMVKARFVELLGLEKAVQNAEPLENFLENITYGFTNPMPDAEEGPWKITAKDIIDGKINFLTARKTTTEAFDALTEKSRPIIGDVLLTKDGTLGRMAIVEDTNICVNQSVAVLRCNKRVVPKILMYLLQMPEYQRDMISNAGGGTIKHIYITKVNKMQVAVPSMETQKKILAFLGKIEKIKTTISHSLEHLETLKKALMQKYFG